MFSLCKCVLRNKQSREAWPTFCSLFQTKKPKYMTLEDSHPQQPLSFFKTPSRNLMCWMLIGCKSIVLWPWPPTFLLATMPSASNCHQSQGRREADQQCRRSQQQHPRCIRRRRHQIMNLMSQLTRMHPSRLTLTPPFAPKAKQVWCAHLGYFPQSLFLAWERSLHGKAKALWLYLDWA